MRETELLCERLSKALGRAVARAKDRRGWLDQDLAGAAGLARTTVYTSTRGGFTKLHSLIAVAHGLDPHHAEEMCLLILLVAVRDAGFIRPQTEELQALDKLIAVLAELLGEEVEGAQQPRE